MFGRQRAEAVDGARRGFLKSLAVLGVAGAATVAQPGDAAAKPRRKKLLVFRLSPRKTKHCRACGRHHQHKVFLTHALADANRAHPGCDCPITRQVLRRRTFKQLFGPNGVAQSGIADLRLVPRKEKRRS